MTRVLVIGPGAIGCTVGAALIETGHDVTFCARQSFTLVSVQKAGEAAKTFPARVVTSEKDISPADWVVLCVKAHQVPSAEGWLQRRGRSAYQGCRAAERRRTSRAGRALCAASTPLSFRSSWSFRLRAWRQAKSFGTGLRCSRFRAMRLERNSAACSQAHLSRAETTDDLVTVAWKKLCLNAPGGAILSLTGQPMRVFHKPGIADVARAILAECVAVGRAEGANLDEGLIEPQIAFFMRAGPDEGNSMYVDRMAGREMEWDARNGVIVRKGARHGIPTPVSAALVPLLAALTL